MIEAEFSPYVIDLMVREGMRPENVLLTARCDRSLDGDFEDTYILLCIDKIAFLTVEYDKQVSRVYNGYLSKKENPSKKKDDVPCRKKRYQVFDISDIKEMRIVNLVASGMVNIKFEDEAKTQVAVTAFTSACMKEVSKVSRAVQKIKKDGALNMADFKDDAEAYCPKCGRAYIDRARKICPVCADRKSIMLRLMKMASKYKMTIFGAVFFILLSAVCNVVMPYMSGTILYDKGLNAETGGFWYGKVFLIVLIILGIYLLYCASNAFTNILMTKLSQNMVFDIKSSIFEAFQGMSMGYFIKNRIGNIMNRINNDTSAIASFFVSGIPYAVRCIINFVAGVTMVLVLNPRVFLLALIPTFVIVFVLKITHRYMMRMYQRVFNAGSSLTSAVSDSLRGVKVVKAFGKEKNEISRFDKVNEKNYRVNYKLALVRQFLNPIYSLSISLVTYGIWIISGIQIVDGSVLMSYGIMTSTLSYFSMMLDPIASFSNFMDWWRNAMNAGQRMYELIDADPDVKEAKNPIIMDKMRGDITIKDVTFGYEPNNMILNNIDVDIKAGEMIGIVGHSGAGKSTLINLITRMYDVNEGEIDIDGYNIKEIANRTLRDNIALVTQDTYIFQGTVLENIAYANPDAKREEVIAAAKIARCHDFIEAMPEGYDTMVGPGYRAMSGGERQRVSIARAVLLNPRILILDEATAALDTETEMSIQEALDNLTEGRTTLAIAHRLSTLRNADRLIVIEGGKISEVGTHEELVHNKGVYYRLMRAQAEALKAKGV